jgi:hypothetical protein
MKGDDDDNALDHAAAESGPRSDLKVTLDGVEVKPALALGSWLAFQKIGNQAMVMGDLVLTAEEVSPVMNSS